MKTQSKKVQYPDDYFGELLEEVRALHAKKGKDYGSDEDPIANIRATVEFGVAPLTGVLIQINNKMHRLRRFVKRGALANESARDSLRDIVVYGTIALQLYDEEHP